MGFLLQNRAMAKGRLLVLLVPLWGLFFARPVRAGDGFFRGEGVTVFPLKNKKLRVDSETLMIRPRLPKRCYEVYYKGKPEPPKKSKKKDFASIGRPTSCIADPDHLGLFSPEWFAEAVYEVEALENAKDVLLGFPVPIWEAEFYGTGGLDSIPAPGIARFKTFIDSRTVSQVYIKWLDIPGKKAGKGRKKEEKVLGYVWKASFRKGRRYKLKTTYEFGVDSSNSFYEGLDYPEGETPWYLDKDWFGSGAGFTKGAHRLRYRLTPLKRWASPPPRSIKIIIKFSISLPIIYAVPMGRKPTCVGKNSLHYEIRGVFPAEDLKLSYPSSQKGLRTMSTTQDWERWNETIGGGDARVECSLMEAIRKTSSDEIKRLAQTRKCLRSCEHR